MYSDFEKLVENFSNLRYEFLPLLLSGTFLAMIVKSGRQYIMLKKLNISFTIKNSILLYLAGSSMTLTPGGTGSIIKSYFLKKRYGINISNTFPLVILERFHDLFAVVCMITITLFFIPHHEVSILISFVFLLSILGFIAIRSKKIFLFIKKILIKLPKINSFVLNIDESYNGFSLLTKPKITFQSWVLSMVSWIIDAVVIYLVFQSFGLDLDIIFTTLSMQSSFLLGNLAIIPAGLGVTEISAVGFLLQEGIELSLATSIIVVIRLVTTWFATIIGLVTTRIYLDQK